MFIMNYSEVHGQNSISLLPMPIGWEGNLKPVVSLSTVLCVTQMVVNYGSDDNVTNLVDTYDFTFLPVVNPDGYVYTFTDVSILKVRAFSYSHLSVTSNGKPCKHF